MFFETLEVFLNFKHKQFDHPIILDVWDDDGFINAKDFLGRAIIHLDPSEDITSHDDSIPQKPKWYPLRLGSSLSDPIQGEILASFAIVDESFIF